MDFATTRPVSVVGPNAATHPPTTRALDDVVTSRVRVVEEVTTTVTDPLTTDFVDPDASRRRRNVPVRVRDVLVVAVIRPLALATPGSARVVTAWDRRPPRPGDLRCPERTLPAVAGHPAGPAGERRTLRAVMTRTVDEVLDTLPATTTQSPGRASARVAATVSVKRVDPLKSTVTCPLAGFWTCMLEAESAATVPTAAAPARATPPGPLDDDRGVELGAAAGWPAPLPPQALSRTANPPSSATDIVAARCRGDRASAGRGAVAAAARRCPLRWQDCVCIFAHLLS